MLSLPTLSLSRRPRTTEMAVEVVGAGYVGLVTAACLASLGHSVRCIDADEHRVAQLRNGFLPFYEPGLDELVTRGVASGRLQFSDDLLGSALGADMVFIAVGTLDGTGQWTDRNVRSVLERLLHAPVVPPLLVVRSTLRPGRMQELSAMVQDSGRGAALLLHPEFTREGTAVSDFLHPDRIVIGIPEGAAESVVEPLRALYARVDAPVLVVDHTSAELIKIGSNAFLATKVTFANEFARLCRELGGDMGLVRKGLGLDSRIGEQFLRAGPGFGGSCLPSQIDLLAEMAQALGLAAEVIPAVKRLNAQQPAWIVSQVLDQVSVPRPTVALLGLSFKAGTDDVRESSALRLAAEFARRDVPVTAFDPLVKQIPNSIKLRVASSLEGAVAGADAAVIATDWPEFAAIDWRQAARLMRSREVFDARNVVDAAAAARAGFRVRSLERADVEPTTLQPKVGVEQAIEIVAA